MKLGQCKYCSSVSVEASIAMWVVIRTPSLQWNPHWHLFVDSEVCGIKRKVSAIKETAM